MDTFYKIEWRIIDTPKMQYITQMRKSLKFDTLSSIIDITIVMLWWFKVQKKQTDYFVIVSISLAKIKNSNWNVLYNAILP